MDEKQSSSYSSPSQIDNIFNFPIAPPYSHSNYKYLTRYKILINFILFLSFVSVTLSQSLPMYINGVSAQLPFTQIFQVQYNYTVEVQNNWPGTADCHVQVRNKDTTALMCGSGSSFVHSHSIMCTLPPANYTFYIYINSGTITTWNAQIDYYNKCFVPNCLTCTDSITCSVCNGTYLITSNFTCQQAICLTIQNCTYCPNSVCNSCDTTFLLKNNKCSPCIMNVHQCLDCQSLSKCNICQGEFVLSSTFTCECPVGLWEVTNICINMVGCTSAVIQNDVKICKFCDISKSFQVSQIYKNCTCISGFSYSSSLKECIQICGDGKIFKAQCDDGNLQNNDGCSSNCTLQPGFNCKTLNNANTSCIYIKDLMLNLDYIMKDPQSNSANMFFQFQNLDQISIKRILSSTFKPVVSANITDIMTVMDLSINQDASGKIFLVVKVSYNKTLEGHYLNLQFGFQNTSILSQNTSLSFYCRGKNFPLIISLYYGQFSTISTFTLAYGIAVYIIILFMIFSDKFIGVETLVTIQLIYFSQLLISDIGNWPQAFTVFAPLKIVTGYNNLFTFQENQSNLLNQFYIKFRFLDFRQTFLVNNITNLSILFVITIIYIIIFVLKNSKTTQFQQKIKQSKIKNNKLFEKFKKQMKYSRISYHVLFNFCMIILLQLLASIIIQTFNLDRKSSSQSSDKKNEIYQIFNKLSMILGFVIIIVVCTNNFLNTMLNSYQTRHDHFQYAQHQKKYVQKFILYVLITGIGLFCFNCIQIVSKYPMSLLILLLALIYLVYLLIYSPYKYTLFVHRLGIILNQFAFIFALLIINLINLSSQFFHGQIPENYLLLYSYFMCAFSTILILIAMIRFYYEFRYEEEIKKKMRIQQEKRKQQALNKSEEREIFQQKMRLLNQKGGNQDKDLKNIFNSKNRYLYPNQVKQSQKLDYLLWLQSKKHLNKYQKQHMYYRKYKERPQHQIQKQQGTYFIINQKKNNQETKQKAQPQSYEWRKQSKENTKIVEKTNQKNQLLNGNEKLKQKIQTVHEQQRFIQNEAEFKQIQRTKEKYEQDQQQLEQVREHLRISLAQSKQKNNKQKSLKNKQGKTKIVQPQYSKNTNLTNSKNKTQKIFQHTEEGSSQKQIYNKRKKSQVYSKSKRKQH